MSLELAVASVPAPPCVGCENNSVCTKRELCCSAFVQYTTGKRSPGKREHSLNPKRIPSREKYDLLMKGIRRFQDWTIEHKSVDFGNQWTYRAKRGDCVLFFFGEPTVFAIKQVLRMEDGLDTLQKLTGESVT